MSKDKYLPDFIIVGGKKCGSSTLRDTLQTVPGIVLTDQEGNYFNIDENYRQGLSYYRRRLEAESKILKDKDIFGEKTVEYSFNPVARQRISKDIINIRFIWIFRNPIDRFYSDYLHEIKKGTEKRSFERVLSEGKESQYFLRGKYADQLQVFYSFSKKEQNHIIFLEDFIKNPKDAMRSVFEFIGKDPDTMFKLMASNKTVLPRFPKTLYFGRIYLRGKVNILWKLIVLLNFKWKKPGYKKLTPNQRKRLSDLYEVEKQYLENLLEIKLNWK